MNLTPRDRRAILLGAATLAVVLGVYFVVMPIFASWQDARARIVAAQAELSELETDAKRRASQRRRLMALIGPGVVEPPMLVPEAELQFVETVEEAVQASGLNVSSVRPQSVRRTRDLQGMSLVGVGLEAKCKPQQLVDCLTKLHGLDQLILVERLNTNNTDGKGSLEVSMVLTTIAREIEGDRR